MANKKKNLPAKKKQKQVEIHPPKKRFSLLFVGAMLFLGLFILLAIRFAGAYEHAYMKTLPKEEISRIRLTPTPILHHVTLPLRLPILMYHYVEIVADKRDTMRKSLDILPTVFDAQIKTLQNAGYTFLTASQIPDILDGKLALPQKPIVLTFDDGYRDFYTDAYPVLKKYHVPATAYVVPGFLDKPNYLFKTQLDEINRDGLVEIAAHTVHHAYLKGMNLEKAKKEIVDSKNELEAEIGKPVVSFAYPYGAFDLKIADLVKQAGFTNAVSTLPGVELDGKNTFFLFRLRPGNRTGKTLLTYLEQMTYRPY